MTWVPVLSAAVLVTGDRYTKVWAAHSPAVRRGFLFYGRKQFPRSGFASEPVVLVAVWFAALAAIVAGIESGLIFQTAAAQIGVGAAIGGSASNLYDRLRRRAVIDFLDLRWWPVFNLADVGITVGAITALWWR